MSSSEQHNSEAATEDNMNQWLSPATGWDTGHGGTSEDEDPAPHDLIFQWKEAAKVYSKDVCLAALRGERVPVAAADVGTLSHVVKLSILRGIRHHHGFGTELRDVGSEDTFFKRALNARAIMSNTIPDMDVVQDANSIPYCIWYPDIASEETYRELARRYPQMRYQVGRACAVAGYSGLYKELHLLPDVSTAEEAQDSVMRGQRGGGGDSNRGSAEIFQHIVQQPVRWQIMNDYTRTVEADSPVPARHGLNGDTAIVSTLQLKRSFETIRGAYSRFCQDKSRLEAPDSVDEELAPCYFNITEDWNIDEYTSREEDGCGCAAVQWTKRPASEAMLELLWSPLPVDLPWGDKDLLILMAAYRGDVDRYARLRRPQNVSPAELNCLVRGIYHNTSFARWCSIHLSGRDANCCSRAIAARFIMSNDLSRIPAHDDDSDDDSDSDDDVMAKYPWQIWYPQRAAAATYRELARRQPAAMTGPVARACVVADYRDLWDEMVDSIEPYAELVEEALASPNAHYIDSLRRSCEARGIDADHAESIYPDSVGRGAFAALQVERPATNLRGAPRVDDVLWLGTSDPEVYDSWCVNVSEVELFIAAPREARPPAGFDEVDLEQLYYERRHPPSPGGGDESKAYRKRWVCGRRRSGSPGGRGIAWGGR